MQFTVANYNSPFGWINLSARNGRLVKVSLSQSASPTSQKEPLRPFLEALDRYFRQKEDPSVPWDAFDLSGTTAFQQELYYELAHLPFGRTVTYSELATLLGMPKAARAVGQALKCNPLPIFIPCHRVVRNDGHLGGFNEGTNWKANLLKHEGWTILEGKLS